MWPTRTPSTYSNVGYYVLAELISRVSRLPWVDYMTEQLFKPVLDSDRILTTAERQQMMTAAPLRDGTFAPYGFGWHVEQFNGHRYIWHGGGLPGFSSNFARFPDDRLTIIALSNGDDVDMDALIARLARMFLPSK
jgi:CubicO group peptidase (beta-lactamase class C family)